MTGDFENVFENCKSAIEISPIPMYEQAPKIALGYSYLFAGDFEKAKKVMEECYSFSEELGYRHISTMTLPVLSVVLISEGQMQNGLNLLEKARNNLLTNQRKSWYAITEHIFAEIYAQITAGPKPSLSVIAKNIGFLLKHVPFASRKAEAHFNKAIELMHEIGAKGHFGTVYLGLAKFYIATKRTEQAKQALLEAIKTFEECEAELYLKQANELLASLP
jgi:tetratricopeptide (TPR) repeat protein